MKPISNDFKEEISKLGREYSDIIGVYGSSNNSMITEDNRYILTQSDLLLITGAEEGGIQYEITDENIFKVDIIQKSEIFSTIMKELDFESDLNLLVGNVINYKLGLKLGDLTEEEANQEVNRILEKGIKAFYKFMYENVENPTQWASGYASTGLTPSPLSTLKNGHYITDEEWEILQKYCDTSTTTVTLYPISPFGINDYTINTTIDSDYQQYEYIDYGKYIIYKKEYKEDTKTYDYTCYDNMLRTMIKIENNTSLEGTSISTILEFIANRFELEINIDSDVLEEYPNLENAIPEDTFKDMDITYRDVLDMICQACGFNLYIETNEILFKNIKGDSVDTIDEKYLKDVNVTFKERYGPVNSLVLSRSDDNDNIYKQDEASISANGLHEYKIKNNLILDKADRDDFIDSIYDKINGLEFYIDDFESTGICYLDLLDSYNVSIQGNTYNCKLMNDEIHIKNGISENIYTEMPEETVTEYSTSGKSDKEVSFMVDKQRGEINAKVSKGDVINEINLDESGVSINASKINLNGAVTANNNFKILTDGSMEAVNGKFSGVINGGTIKVQDNQYATMPYISVGDLDAPRYSYGVTIFDHMVVAEDYRDSDYEGPVIKTEYDGGYAQLIGGDVECTGTVNSTNGVCQGSLEELKKDFKPFNNALDIIKDIDIYKYKYKEQDYDKEHIGFVIGDKYNYSKEVTNKDNNGVDLYSFISVCCEAIKEQQEEIETLKQEIKELKERIDK